MTAEPTTHVEVRVECDECRGDAEYAFCGRHLDEKIQAEREEAKKVGYEEGYEAAQEEAYDEGYEACKEEFGIK